MFNGLLIWPYLQTTIYRDDKSNIPLYTCIRMLYICLFLWLVFYETLYIISFIRPIAGRCQSFHVWSEKPLNMFLVCFLFVLSSQHISTPSDFYFLFYFHFTWFDNAAHTQVSMYTFVPVLRWVAAGQLVPHTSTYTTWLTHPETKTFRGTCFVSIIVKLGHDISGSPVRTNRPIQAITCYGTLKWQNGNKRFGEAFILITSALCGTSATEIIFFYSTWKMIEFGF